MKAMATKEEKVNREKTQEGRGILSRFFHDAYGVAFHPGAFFEGIERKSGYVNGLIFLVSCGILYSILRTPFVMQDRLTFALIDFVNAFFMPFLFAFLLYLASFPLCKRAFTYQALFGITAYANVTILAAWIPGMSWLTGLWKFYLIGLGMVKVGRISNLRSFGMLMATAITLLGLIGLLQSILRS